METSKTQISKENGKSSKIYLDGLEKISKLDLESFTIGVGTVKYAN